MGILTSDPNLLLCELHRADGHVALGSAQGPAAAGVGWYTPEELLLRRFPVEQPPVKASELLGERDASDALIFHRRDLPRGMSLEENAQPFRFRQWLFAHDGEVSGWSRARMAVLAALPDHLQRNLRGDTDSEAIFALFLKELREVGRTDDPRLEPELAATLLLKAGNVMQKLSRDAGGTEAATLNMVATNGRMLLAARLGPKPLFYKPFEGMRECGRCQLTERTPEGTSTLGAHRRLRSLVVSSSPLAAASWLSLEDGEALAVDARLNGRKVRG